MAPPAPLPVEALAWSCPPALFEFASTAELPDLEGTIGQARALEAIEFALAMDRPGYNVYALGSHGLGKHAIVRRLIERQASGEPVPPDWCHVSDFSDSRHPRLLRLPAGRGRVFRQDIARLLSDLLPTLRNAFENDEYRGRRQAIEDELKERQERALGEVEEAARRDSIAIVRTPQGLAFAPMADGRIITPDKYQELPDHVRKHLDETTEALQKQLQAGLANLPAWTKETRDQIKALNDETAAHAVAYLFEQVRRAYGDLPEIVSFLDAALKDIIERVEVFLQVPGQAQGVPMSLLEENHPLFRRYRVNLLVDNAETRHAPVIYEDDPSYDRLFGRIEQRAEQGALVTDFLMIRGGALHRANGGYLILDAEKLLTRPFVYDGLKRTLRAREARIESPLQSSGLFATATLEPEPMPLEVKIVILGERMPWYLLSAYDPDFPTLFKVAADFDERLDRTADSCHAFARQIATIARAEGLRPFGPGAVARILQQTSRLADHSEKLSADASDLGNLLREADFQAGRADAAIVDADHVREAIDAQARRLSRLKELSQEQITEGTIAIDVDGEVVGQINGLAVLQLGGFMFGRPSRITARVRMGGGAVIDIERESRLGGPLHSKGVLILSGFLASTFVPDLPLSLSATLVFEQSYGGVDGDSASSTELYALLSALAEIPIRQSLAVTGSVNQRGQVQAIGGANEKIEGFFDLCAAAGLTGRQGVLIPATNRRHLMLHERVREAVAQGLFSIYPVTTIEEGIELLTGVPAGVRGPDGAFPEGTVYRRVEDRLRHLAELRRAMGRGGDTQVAIAQAPSEAPPPAPPEPPVPPARSPG